MRIELPLRQEIIGDDEPEYLVVDANGFVICLCSTPELADLCIDGIYWLDSESSNDKWKELPD